ncbi:penicillin acylase family protein [Massilia aurea]|uniref:penicillin acylase family protein n=1 Tax=Massilia aurea TaxID=373040 RepID=UPI002161F151|nr:penicillin acylase family protein [Massilia aurea]MCS0709961.1 penicillin acylase family protein [Massilia aurea]
MSAPDSQWQKKLVSSQLALRFIIFLVVPVVIICVTIYWQLYKALPQSGTVTFNGVGPISVTRDQHGVTSLQANNQRDVFFATGYVHAQDRAWQLEILRRTAQGRLSEVLGKGSVQQDIWFRTLGIYRAAASARKVLSRDAFASLQAYSEGVNAGLDSQITLAPEFLVFRVKPERWTPTDSLAVIKLFALTMAGSMDTELERYVAKQLLEAEKFDLLFGPAAALTHEAALSFLPPADVVGSMLDRSLVAGTLLGIGEKYAGSNAWVVSGSHTTDGKPLLANDPHMGLSMPSPWYAVKQTAPAFEAAGMTIVGTPLVIFGKNKSIAWGGTNMMADVQDLFFEQVRGSDSLEYRDGSEWRAFEVRHETINVARPSPSWLHEEIPSIQIRVRETVRGPVISDVQSHFDQPVSLRWTGLDSDDTSYEAFYRLNHASNWSEFRRALALQVIPTLNMLYADSDNNIGFTAAGRIPVRAKGQGAIPQPGWTREYSWTSVISPLSMPYIYNPDQGYIVSANDKMVEDIYPSFITLDWAPSYRAMRIKSLLREAITSRKPIDSSLTMAIQNDVVAPEAREMLPLLLRTQPTTMLEREAQQYLRNWDHRMSLDSPAATIFSVWMQHFQQELLASHLTHIHTPRLTAPMLSSLVGNVSPEVMIRAIHMSGPGLCAQYGCPQELRKSFERTLRDLTKLRGMKPADWRWGGVHSLHLRHTPFSQVPVLSSLFDWRHESPGGPYSLNVSNSRFIGSGGYEQTFGATFRQIMQPGTGLHLLIGSSGQSGNPFSSDYSNMSKLFAAGMYLDMTKSAPFPASSATFERVRH